MGGEHARDRFRVGGRALFFAWQRGGGVLQNFRKGAVGANVGHKRLDFLPQTSVKAIKALVGWSPKDWKSVCTSFWETA